MKNLNGFGVQELNSKEIRETEGGFFLEIVGAITTVYAAIEMADFIAEEFTEGWSNPK